MSIDAAAPIPHDHQLDDPGPVADYDVIVIGGGPAGLSAALMTGRSRRRTLVLDDGLPRNRFAAHMQAVLGSDGRAPEDLLESGREELHAYGVEVRAATVTGVSTGEHGVRVETSGGDSITARALVAASGISDRLPDVPGLRRRWGTTVLHCPYCHGWEVREQRLGVVLTGPMMVHLVQLVRQLSQQVTAFFGGFVDPDTGTATPVELEPEVRRRLQARGVMIITEPVVALEGEGSALSAVRLASGRTVEVDARSPAEPCVPGRPSWPGSTWRPRPPRSATTSPSTRWAGPAIGGSSPPGT